MAKPKRLAFDLDGVLVDFCRGYAELLIRLNGNKMPEGWEANPEVAYPVWLWERQHGYSEEEEAKAWKEIHQSPNWWQELPFYPWTRETLDALDKLSMYGAEVIFITNRHGFMAKRQAELWLTHNGVWNPTVVLAKYKTPVIESLGVDFFIDDKPDTISSLIGDVTRDIMFYETHNGTPRFAKGLKDNIYLMSAPYNKGEGHRLPGTKVVDNPLDALKRSGLI